jgi:hypothetical protein
MRNEATPPAALTVQPVAYRSQLASGNYTYCNTPQFFDNAEPLYTTPPAAQRQWVGLTDAEKQWIRITEWTIDELIEWVNTKLKEKNA